MQYNLHEVATNIESGDLLLFRGRGPWSTLIKWAGRSEYSHAAKADWWGDKLFCCEIREVKGGRAVTLESQVARYPGAIDVYKTDPNGKPAYDRRIASEAMRQLAGCDYGWTNVARAALVHLPYLVSLILKIKFDYQVEDLDLEKHPPFCSQAVAWADQTGGVDPVPNLSNRLTLPGDLARSHFYEKRYTLIGV